MSGGLDEVHFLPRIGSEYDNGGKRVLLLGESHYGKDIGRDETISAVNDYLTRNMNSRFFGGAIRVVFGPDAVREDIEKAAVYNYVQQIVGDKARMRPTKAMWEEAKAPFKAVLEQLQPDKVLCLGAVLYGHLPKDWGMELRTTGAELFREGRLWCKVYHYHVNGKDIPVYGILHPSSQGFNAAVYHERLKEYLG